MKEEKHCCCHAQQEKKENTEELHRCTCAGQEILVMGKSMRADLSFDEVATLLSTAEQVWDMPHAGRLTPAARALWNLHKEVIDATLAGGWDNPVHPWDRDLQDFWRYPLAFCCYGMLSMAMIEPGLKPELCEYARKTVLLMKDAPIWDEWVRYGFCDNPITKDNIMYKGHLHFVYGVYRLLSGSTEFDEEYRFLTDIILREYESNSQNPETPYYGIQCEPDQYFPQCNSVAMISMKIHDLIFGTDYNEKYSVPIYDFIRTHMSDRDTGLFFSKYHPSHDQAEPYVTGFTNGWALTMLHPYNPALLEDGYRVFMKYYLKPMMGGHAAYLRDYASYDEASTGVEESTGQFYTLALCKEFNDPIRWELFARYFRAVYGTEIRDGTARLTLARPEDESYIHNYLLWGEVHQPWAQVYAYDWKAFRGGKTE